MARARDAIGDANNGVDGGHSEPESGADTAGGSGAVDASVDGAAIPPVGNANGVADPEIAGGKPPPKKRGRPSRADAAARAAGAPGAAAAPTVKKVAKSGVGLSAGYLTEQIHGLHKMAAMFSGNPILELAPDESERLGNAIYAVAEEYNIAFVGPRAVWINLIATVGIIYGGRLMMIQQLQMAARRAAQVRAAPASANAAGAAAAAAMGNMDFGGGQPN